LPVSNSSLHLPLLPWGLSIPEIHFAAISADSDSMDVDVDTEWVVREGENSMYIKPIGSSGSEEVHQVVPL